MPFFKLSFSLYHFLFIFLLLPLSSLVVAELNTSTDKLQGRNKSSITDDIKQQLKAVSNTDLKSGEKPVEDAQEQERPEPVLGINTADVREDTSSVQFLDLF